MSEQLNFVGVELNIKKRDIQALQDINKIIVENISSGLITVSSDYHVLLSNKSALKILGETDIMDRDIDLVIPGMKQLIFGVNEREEKLRQNGEPLTSLDARSERRHVLPNGERIILGMSVSPLLNDEGHVSGYIIIFQDLTEIVRLEGAMRRQEKLAAVGKLAAGIAHEIRNPLASISGSIELLKSLLTLNTPEQNKLMEIMLKEIDRLNNLITEFLEFVRPGDRKLEVCPVDNILNEVLDMMTVNTNLPQHIKQIRKINAKALVPGDKNKLKQVFLNLAINAYQAMGDVKDGSLTVETIVKDNNLYVHFRDNGHGMSDQTQKRLFEPFFTTKPKGTGLGLATVHKILENHDAKIFVESHEDKGTEFTIRFNELIREGANRYEGQNTGS
jgi:two-component system sensor histidine kinase PilS (NtrC family)